MLSLEFSPARVKRIRVLLGETQEQFAKRLGVNINMVTRWETGQAEPMRGPVLKALLDAEAAV
ncbi:hypothetical protein LCGC14_2563790 [marine sediment metagenome]|uniref:HTH cro/C1-type domain-containing protein n=1 Tax=marine sediment metagenome TaxID=412755 RepID=A0A0F9AJS0_9ZZZZ